MRVVALKAWSNGSISMEERQIAELPDALATSLIAQGIVAPTALPAVTDADEGKVLTVNNSGVWGAQNPKFVVTLTPTALDYSGTMDHTVAEIDAAYKAGQKIVFHLAVEGLGSFDSDVTMVGMNGRDYPSYNATMFETNTSTLMLIATMTTDDGTKATYSTNIYALTPAT